MKFYIFQDPSRKEVLRLREEGGILRENIQFEIICQIHFSFDILGEQGGGGLYPRLPRNLKFNAFVVL